MEHYYKQNATITNTSSAQVGLHWSIQEEESQIDIAVVINLPKDNVYIGKNGQPPLLWVGFGMSEMGGTKGSDMFVFSFRHGQILDCHHGVEEFGLPRIDECGQDWILRNFSNNSNNGESFLVVEVSRPLQAGDVNEDLPFLNDSSVTVIAATKIFVTWGGIIEDSILQHSEEGFRDLSSWMKPHSEESLLTKSLRFFQDAGSNKQETLEFIDLIPSSEFEVPANTTTYKDYCFAIAELQADDPSLDVRSLLEDGAHIVKFEDITHSSVDIIHHMDLHGTINQLLARDSRLCRMWTDFIHPWEVGSDRTFSLPALAGFPLGGKKGFLGFRVEVHYHNPNHVAGIIDRSGVRIWYTRKKRRYDAGIMNLGDPGLILQGRPTSFWPDDVGLNDSDNSTVTSSIRTNKSAAAMALQHSFYCPPACFSRERMNQQHPTFSREDGGAKNENVVVFKEVMHMHSTGSRMTNIQFDASGNSKRASEINYFDFLQGAGFHVRQKPYIVDTGDSFVSTCYFDNETKRKVVFGSGSNDEMCQTFLWYYPSALDDDKALDCNFWDESSRDAANINDTSVHGCEVGYNSSLVDKNMNRYYQSSEDSKSTSNGGICQNALPFGSWNARTIQSYPTYSNATRSSWPSLQISIEGPQNITEGEQSNNNTLYSSNCSLCLDGSRPLHPNVSLEEYFDFGDETTCDFVDAWIGVLFSDPELVGYSWEEVPNCSEYYDKYGELCGCALYQADEDRAIGTQENLLLLAVAITTIVLIFLSKCGTRIAVSLRESSAVSTVVSSGDTNNTEEILSLTEKVEGQHFG